MYKRLLVIVLLLTSVGVYAQERALDCGGIVSAEAEVGLGKGFGLSIEEELRFDQGFTQLDRWLNSVGVDYSCLHNRMNIGLTADYIRRHNDKGYFENRARLGLQVTYTEEWHHFKFQLRSKLMSTFLDNRTGDHPVNPRLYWRNRLKLSYQPVNSRFRYALSAELFLLTNDPRKSWSDNLRAVASVDYRLSRRYYLSAFARIDYDLQPVNPEDIFYVGLTLKGKY